MGFSSSPGIVTDGLIFACDQSNEKSYKGPIMSNLSQTLSTSGTGVAAGYSLSLIHI